MKTDNHNQNLTRQEIDSIIWESKRNAKIKLSPAIYLLMQAKSNRIQSYHSYNPLHSILRLAIKGQFEFYKNDLVNMRNDGGGYYGGNSFEQNYFSHHEQGRGQNEYSLACNVNNVSACHAFERLFDIKPYMIAARRVVLGIEYYLDRRIRIRATGYQQKRKVLLCVQEEYIEDKGWTKTKHPSFDNKDWREFVKENNEFKDN